MGEITRPDGLSTRKPPRLLAAQITAFIAIVEAGSITAAADELGVGKSGLSDNLRHLENTLGVRLLARTTRRQNLTAIGREFYTRCRDLRDISTRALEDISQHLARPMGRLRITAPHVVVDDKIAPAIARLIRTYPQLRPELFVSDERLDLITHQFDLAVSIGDLPDSDYRAQRVGTLRDILCISPSLLARLGLPATVVNDRNIVETWPYIAHKWEGREIAHRLINRRTGEEILFRFQRAATLNTLQAVFRVMSEGAGIAVIPEPFVRPSLEAGAVLPILTDFHPRQVGIFAVHPFGNLPPTSVRIMIEVMKGTAAG